LTYCTLIAQGFLHLVWGRLKGQADRFRHKTIKYAWRMACTYCQQQIRLTDRTKQPGWQLLTNLLQDIKQERPAQALTVQWLETFILR
jgi:hypothetical protein